jgi:hypothetical protein
MLLGLAGNLAIIEDVTQSVAAYQTGTLTTPVWTAAVKTVVGPEVIKANGQIRYVWATGGYRDAQTGKPAGFGASLKAPDMDDTFSVLDGRVIRSHYDETTSTYQAVPWDTATDKAAWAKPVSVDFKDSMAVSGGKLLVVPPAPASGSKITGSVTAYDLATGDKAWTVRAGANSSIAVDDVSAVGSEFVMAVSDAVVWLDAATGKEKRRVALQETGWFDGLFLTDKAVVVSTDAEVFDAPDAGRAVASRLPLTGLLKSAVVEQVGGTVCLLVPDASGPTVAGAPEWFTAVEQLTF